MRMRRIANQHALEIISMRDNMQTLVDDARAAVPPTAPQAVQAALQRVDDNKDFLRGLIDNTEEAILTASRDDLPPDNDTEVG